MNVITSLLILCVGVFIYFEPAKWLLNSWIVNPFYKHGFMVLLASIIIAIFKVFKSKVIYKETNQWRYWILGSATLFIIGYIFNFYYFKTIPIFLTVLGIAYLFSNHIPTRDLRFAILFPIIAVPLPFLSDLTSFLQFFMANLATSILQFLNYEIITEGATIYLPNATFVIGAPSSGIQSIIALLTLMIPVVHFTNTSFRKKALLYSLIIPIAMLGNLLRILTLFFVAIYFGEAVAADFWHDLGSILFFILTFTILFVLWIITIKGIRPVHAKPTV